MAMPQKLQKQLVPSTSECPFWTIVRDGQQGHDPHGDAANIIVLTVGDGTNTTQLDFDGNYQLGNFKFASDDTGGTLVIDPPVAAPSVSIGHQSDSFVFGDQLGQSGLQEPHSGATFTNLDGNAFAAHDFDAFHFGAMAAPPSQPSDFGKFGLANATQDPVHVQQQALVQAVEPAHDLSTFLGGTEPVATQATAAHPDGHFIVRA
jgi:hypothetical protein